jgi:hypothetical protein
MIDELTNPTDPKHPSFHVVAPSYVLSFSFLSFIVTKPSSHYSLPGYVFSQRARVSGMDVIQTGFVFDKLMSKLGYQHYIAQGGDW